MPSPSLGWVELPPPITSTPIKKYLSVSYILPGPTYSSAQWRPLLVPGTREDGVGLVGVQLAIRDIADVDVVHFLSGLELVMRDCVDAFLLRVGHRRDSEQRENGCSKRAQCD